MNDTAREFNRLLRQEFSELLPNTIFEIDKGVYQVFGKYQLIAKNNECQVFCHATDVGIFGNKRSALSWCIADKYKDYNLARKLLETDQKLRYLNNDINTRASLADSSRNLQFREEVGTKLETKIIHKKQLENQLAKCVNWAKYYQQRGFNNEIARTGRGQPNKTSR
jgi:hypothetical protein